MKKRREEEKRREVGLFTLRIGGVVLGIRHVTPSMLDRCQEIMYWRSVPYQVRSIPPVQTALK